MRNRSCVLCGVVAMLLAVTATERAALGRPPDVLVVICDQWNPRYLSWETGLSKTPNLDRAASEGMVFDACYVTSPVCMPSRISLVTGLYPHNQGHNVWGNANLYHLSATVAPMFRDIKAAGYTTAQIGKLHWWSGNDWSREYPSMSAYHQAMGLDEVISITGPPSSPKENDPYCKHLAEIELLKPLTADNHQRLLTTEYEPRPSLAKPEDYHDIFTTGLATQYIGKASKEKPICLVVSLHSPHPPLDAPGAFATMYDPQSLKLPGNVPEEFDRQKVKIRQADLRKMLANYLGKITLADQCIGRLIDAMKARGTWDDALFVMTSDHGEMMGSHGYLSKGRFYEESARVPLVMRWPGRIRQGHTAALTQMFDVYPTIVEAVGGKTSAGRLARSALPVAEGKAAKVRDVVISEIGVASPLHMMVRTEQYKWWVDDDSEFLFDMKADPLEMHNLAHDPARQHDLSQMRAEMVNTLRSTQINLAEGSKPKAVRAKENAAKGIEGDE